MARSCGDTARAPMPLPGSPYFNILSNACRASSNFRAVDTYCAGTAFAPVPGTYAPVLASTVGATASTPSFSTSMDRACASARALGVLGAVSAIAASIFCTNGATSTGLAFWIASSNSGPSSFLKPVSVDCISRAVAPCGPKVSRTSCATRLPAAPSWAFTACKICPDAALRGSSASCLAANGVYSGS